MHQGISLDEIREVFNQPIDVVREQVVELSKDIAYMMTGLQRLLNRPGFSGDCFS